MQRRITRLEHQFTPAIKYLKVVLRRSTFCDDFKLIVGAITVWRENIGDESGAIAQILIYV